MKKMINGVERRTEINRGIPVCVEVYNGYR